MLTPDYETAARQVYAAVLPSAAAAFPPEAADRLAAVRVIRLALEGAYLDGRTEATLALWPAGDPYPNRDSALLTPPNGDSPC